jgi:hypothetical protein
LIEDGTGYICFLTALHGIFVRITLDILFEAIKEVFLSNHAVHLGELPAELRILIKEVVELIIAQLIGF